MAAQSSQLNDKYLAPVEQPVFKLDCKSAFENLTPKEKLYAHYISQASWYGSLICLYQTSVESPVLFSIFQQLFHTDKLETFRANSEKNGVSVDDFKHFLQYVAAFYGNMGNYLSFGDTKFLPRISEEKFQRILESCSQESVRADIVSLFKQYSGRIYSSDSQVLSLGLDDKGISTYYSDNVTSKDVGRVRAFMQQKGISPYNTRLWKLNDNTYEIRIASATKKDPETHQFQDFTVNITYGDHAKFMQLVASALEAAIPHAANENQVKMLQKYLDHFRGGSIDDHKDAQRYWIKDIGPVVESNIGFIESYRDPEGERGEFEGFVAVVNKEMSAKFANLVSNAEQFIPILPWGRDFEKDKFLKPDFTSLEVLTYASSGVPSGINIPNYDDIRQEEGFKNVSLGNVIAARSKDPIEFVLPEDQALYDALEIKSFEVQVGIHELLGHGTGKLFQENSNGQKNFPETLTNPVTGEKIKSWYKQGETWDSKFQSFASTMEECRAECCGIYLCTNPELLTVFGYSDPQQQADIFYINWLIMARAGLRALEFYTPETKKWGQAHMQARFAIMRVMLNAGEGFLQIRQEKDNAFVVLDRSKITTVGMKAIGEFLKRLQVYKSTANTEEGIAWYSEYVKVPEEFLSLREIILARKKPRRVFVQAHTTLTQNGNDVSLVEFDATPEGVIQSFVTRFPANIIDRQ